jgi:hypothetical protein
MNFQMIRVISSPSSSTTGFATLIFFAMKTEFLFQKSANLHELDHSTKTGHCLRTGAACCEIVQSRGGFFPTAHHINFRRTFYHAILQC